MIRRDVGTEKWKRDSFIYFYPVWSGDKPVLLIVSAEKVLSYSEWNATNDIVSHQRIVSQ